MIHKTARARLTDLAALYGLGQTKIIEAPYDSRICNQERAFCEGDFRGRYAGEANRSFLIQRDRKAYEAYKSQIEFWLKSVDAYEELLKPYLPDYSPWDVEVDIAELAITLGSLGLIEWDVEHKAVTVSDALRYAYTVWYAADSLFGLARTAFQESRWDMLLATSLIILQPEWICPQEYWQHKIHRCFGTTEVDWATVSRYPSVQGLEPALDVLASLEIQPSIRQVLIDLGRSLYPDGSPKPTGNIFKERYELQELAEEFNMKGFSAYSQVVLHRDFIDWHHETLDLIGDDLRAIYALYGIDWETIEDVLATLPQDWWVLLRVNPTQPLTLQQVRAAYQQQMLKHHPDRSGDEDQERATAINNAYEIAQQRCVR